MMQVLRIRLIKGEEESKQQEWHESHSKPKLFKFCKDLVEFSVGRMLSLDSSVNRNRLPPFTGKNGENANVEDTLQYENKH